MGTRSSIPLRRFGNTDVQISALGSGGHHIGVAKNEKIAVELVHEALDGGITFYRIKGVSLHNMDGSC